jgi:hypothetical protein
VGTLEITPEIRLAREKWRYRGETRPEFALEPAPGQESVWDYPRPPRMQDDERGVRVGYRGLVLAETRRAVRVLETASPPTFYIRPDDVDRTLLAPSGTSSICEWKGLGRALRRLDHRRGRRPVQRRPRLAVLVVRPSRR